MDHDRLNTSELHRLVAEVDEEHNDTMASFSDEVVDHLSNPAGASGRRRFLTAAGAAGLAVTVGATALVVGGLARGAAAADFEFPANEQAPTDDDIIVLAFIQTVELAAVAAYDAGLGAGKLTADTAAVATVFRGHHLAHARSIGALIGPAGLNVANQSIVNKLGPSFANASNERAVLRAAYDLEEAAAATYHYAMGLLTGSDGSVRVGAIGPIEARHAIVLAQALQLDATSAQVMPAFQNQSAALLPADYPVRGDS